MFLLWFGACTGSPDVMTFDPPTVETEPTVPEPDESTLAIIALNLRGAVGFLRDRDWLDGSLPASGDCDLGGDYVASGKESGDCDTDKGGGGLEGEAAFVMSACRHRQADNGALTFDGSVTWTYDWTFDEDGDCTADSGTEQLTAESLDLSGQVRFGDEVTPLDERFVDCGLSLERTFTSDGSSAYAGTVCGFDLAVTFE